jgi:CDK inhibitor PHO81
MPALVESIKALGLVLIADTSDDTGEMTRSGPPAAAEDIGPPAEWAYRMPGGVNGVMRGTGVLRFNDTIDM